MQTGTTVLGATAMLVATSLGIHSGRAQATAPAAVALQQKAPFGSYLADSAGRALYMFTGDRGRTSNCYDACAGIWPPFTTAGKPTAGGGLQASKLGFILRKGGMQQVTYDGEPLYYYTADSAAGSTEGEDIDQFGGGWYLLSPKGTKIEKD